MFYRPNYSHSFPMEWFFQPEMRLVPVCRPKAPFKRPHYDSLDRLFDSMFTDPREVVFPDYRSSLTCTPRVNKRICRREPNKNTSSNVTTEITPKTIKPLQRFKNIDPSQVNVTIDEKNNTLTIDYEKSDNGCFQKMTETRTLPKFIAEQGLHKQIQCKFEQGQVNIALPEMKAMIAAESDRKEVDQNEKPDEMVVEPEAEAESKSAENSESRDQDGSSKSSADLVAIETEKEFH